MRRSGIGAPPRDDPRARGGVDPLADTAVHDRLDRGPCLVLVGGIGVGEGRDLDGLRRLSDRHGLPALDRDELVVEQPGRPFGIHEHFGRPPRLPLLEQPHRIVVETLAVMRVVVGIGDGRIRQHPQATFLDGGGDRDDHRLFGQAAVSADLPDRDRVPGLDLPEGVAEGAGDREPVGIRDRAAATGQIGVATTARGGGEHEPHAQPDRYSRS